MLKRTLVLRIVLDEGQTLTDVAEQVISAGNRMKYVPGFDHGPAGAAGHYGVEVSGPLPEVIAYSRTTT